MTKRLRARVNLGRDKQGKPVYKWASAYSPEELDAEVARLHQEYDKAHRRGRKPVKASASPVEPSRAPDDKIPSPMPERLPAPFPCFPAPSPPRHRPLTQPKQPSPPSLPPLRA